MKLANSILILIHSYTFQMNVWAAIFHINVLVIVHLIFSRTWLHCIVNFIGGSVKWTQNFIDDRTINQNSQCNFNNDHMANLRWCYKHSLHTQSAQHVDKIEGLRRWFNKINKWLKAESILHNRPLSCTNDCNCASNYLDTLMNECCISMKLPSLYFPFYGAMKFFGFNLKTNLSKERHRLFDELRRGAFEIDSHQS